MPPVSHSVKILLITFSDDNDAKGIKNELKKFGEVIGDVVKDGSKIKGGAYVWKYKGGSDALSAFFKRDEYYLVVLSAVPSGTEALSTGDIKKISKKGLFNIEKFHNDYPEIPIHDIGITVDASEIKKTAESIFELKGLTKDGKLKFLKGKELEKAQKKMDAIRKKMKETVKGKKGITTRTLNIGALIIEDDKDFWTFFNQLKPHTGGKDLKEIDELIVAKLPKDKKFRKKKAEVNVEVGLIVWHHEQALFDEYWVFLVLDKDTLKEGKLDWSGPDVKGFMELYKGVIPMIEVDKYQLDYKLGASEVLNRLKKAYNKDVKPKVEAVAKGNRRKSLNITKN